jgi:hypothetical protein
VTGPVFIIGFQRSGTTLLRMMLDAHPDLAIPLDTTGLWERYAARLDAYGGLAAPSDVARLVADLLQEERIRLWQLDASAEEIVGLMEGGGYADVVAAFYRAYARSRGKRYWGDKDPGNMTRIHLVNDWFPQARFVHIIRDGRDACLSQLEQDFGHSDLLRCASGWCEEVTWVRRIGAILGPARYLELRYEDLVREPVARLREVCAFLGLTYDPAMLEYHRHVERSIPDAKRHIWPLIDRPPQRENAYRWKGRLSEGSRLCFEKRAGALLRALGYDVLPEPWTGAYLEEVRHILSGAVRALRLRARGRHAGRANGTGPAR